MSMATIRSGFRLRWQFLILLAPTLFGLRMHSAMAAEFHPIGYIGGDGSGSPGLSSVAYAVSDDGSVAVGNYAIGGGSQAVSWSLSAGLQIMGNVPNAWGGIAVDMSRDGKTALV